MRKTRAAAALLAALLASQGCTRHYIVSVDELHKLDGYTYRRGYDRPLRTNDGGMISFNASNELWLLGPVPEVKGHFTSIRLTPTTFEGALVGSSELLRADVATIQFAKVEAMDAGQTLLLAGAVTTTALALLYGFFITRPQPSF